MTETEYNKFLDLDGGTDSIQSRILCNSNTLLLCHWLSRRYTLFSRSVEIHWIALEWRAQNWISGDNQQLLYGSDHKIINLFRNIKEMKKDLNKLNCVEIKLSGSRLGWMQELIGLPGWPAASMEILNIQTSPDPFLILILSVKIPVDRFYGP